MSWTTSDMKVSDWLKGQLGVVIPDNAIQSILAGRSVDGNDDLNTLSQMVAELLKADLYVWFCASPSTGQSVEDSDGDWRHKEGSYQVNRNDKKLLLQLANDIYSKYGLAEVKALSRIRLINL